MSSKRKYNKRPIDKRYYNYFDICKMEGIPEVRAKNAIKIDKAEGIKKIKEIESIAHLFEVFEKPIKGGMVNSYGILRRYYDEFKITGEAPKPHSGRPPKLGTTKKIFTLPIDLVEKFYKLVDNANAMSIQTVTYSEMAAVALHEFIQRRPQFIEDEDVN